MTDAGAAAHALLARLEAVALAGWDPYDALASPVLRRLARSRLLRQAAIQTVRRLPVNVRPLLGVPRLRHAKGLALIASAHAKLGLGVRAHEILSELAARSIKTEAGVAWGYDFDVQTRWGYYRRGTPNAVVTAFVLRALLDLEDDEHEALRSQATRYATGVLQRRDGWFAYYTDALTPIHNASVLVADVLWRGSSPGSAARAAAERAFIYTLDCQRHDGSWPYGERSGLGWVDGFHTAYVLESLAPWVRDTGDAAARDAIVRGLDLYIGRLIDADGAARATLDSRYPIDIHALSSGIACLSRLRDLHSEALPAASRLLEFALERMRRPDDRFAYRLHRRWRDGTPYIRWNDAHMLVALAEYDATPTARLGGRRP